MSPKSKSRLAASRTSLLERIRTRHAHVVIIGQGYVGLPLAREVGESGMRVTGYEIRKDIIKSLNAGVSHIADVPRFPAVSEDLALIVEDKVSAEKVLATIMAAGAGTALKNAQVFDVFKGEQIGAGKKSLAYRLTYQADRTLTDVEVAKVREQIVRQLREDLNAVLRG